MCLGFHHSLLPEAHDLSFCICLLFNYEDDLRFGLRLLLEIHDPVRPCGFLYPRTHRRPLLKCHSLP